MHLREYIKGWPKERLAEFATACKTTPGQLKQVAYNPKRRAGEALAIDMERESMGVVTCEEMRPDVDWAYLRSSSREAAKPQESAA